MSVKLSRLGYEATIVMGQSPPGDSYNQDGQGTPLLNGPTEFGPLHPTEKQWSTSPTKFCQQGDVLFCVRGATAGRLNVADKEYCLGRGLAAIRGKPGRFDSNFLRHVLANGYARFQARGVGSTFINISGEELAKFEVPALPLAEQRRIAEMLDRAETLRAKRRAALAQLDTLTQAIFLDLFGDPATNPKGFPEVALGKVFEIARGGSPRPIDDYVTEDREGINWITISDASAGSKYITATKRRIRPEGTTRSRAVKPGDFLLTNSMSFGRPYIMRTSGCIHDGWLVLSPRQDDVDSEFFYCLLGSRAVFAEFERRAAGATVKNLNIELVKAVRIPLPPFSRQRDFSLRVATIDRLKGTHRSSLAQLDALFAALQHRAFRGEL